MSNVSGEMRWWHRTLVALRVVGIVVLVLFIAASVFLSNMTLARASASKARVSAHGGPGSIAPGDLKSKEDAWFQLSHLGNKWSTPDAYLKAEDQADGMLQADSAFGTWKPLGPAPLNSNCAKYCNNFGLVSGRITAEAVNPTNSRDVWLGAADGGVWHSTDGGAHWTPTTDRVQTQAIGSIAIDPNHSNTIYVGTGEANRSQDSYWGVGILKSTDGGATWTRLGFSYFGGLAIGRIAVDPANSQILLLSATVANVLGTPNGGPVIPTNNVGIWRSTDGGMTWTQVIGGVAGHVDPGTDVIFDPANPTLALAGIRYSRLGTTTDPGIYKSTDSGQTWTHITAGVPTGTIARVALGSSLNGKHVYAVLADGSATSFGALLNSSIYVSSDTGTTWTAKNVSGVPGMVSDDNELQWWYDIYAAVDPTDSSGNTTYVGGVDIWKTTDGGNTWKNFTKAYTTGSTHSDQHALVFFNNKSSSYYIGNDGGIWSGTSNGTFTDLNTTGLNTIQFYGGSIGEVGRYAQLYGGEQDNGESQYPVGSPTKEAQWNAVFGGDGGFTAVDYTNNANVYEEYVFLSMNKSTNGGKTWKPATNGINSSDPVNFIAPFILSPTHPKELFAGTDHIYRTTDGANSWTAISPSLDSGTPISIIAVSQSNDNVIYAGDDLGNVYETTDGGATWSGGAVPGSTGGMVRGLAVDPRNPSIVYASFADFAAGPGGHVFKSTDAGKTWTDVSTTLPNIPFSSLQFFRGTLVAGSDVAIFASGNGGSSWSRISGGLPRVVMNQIFTNHDGTELFVATHGRGMWRLS